MKKVSKKAPIVEELELEYYNALSAKELMEHKKKAVDCLNIDLAEFIDDLIKKKGQKQVKSVESIMIEWLEQGFNIYVQNFRKNVEMIIQKKEKDLNTVKEEFCGAQSKVDERFNTEIKKNATIFETKKLEGSCYIPISITSLQSISINLANMNDFEGAKEVFEQSKKAREELIMKRNENCTKC